MRGTVPPEFGYQVDTINGPLGYQPPDVGEIMAKTASLHAKPLQKSHLLRINYYLYASSRPDTRNFESKRQNG